MTETLVKYNPLTGIFFISGKKISSEALEALVNLEGIYKIEQHEGMLLIEKLNLKEIKTGPQGKEE